MYICEIRIKSQLYESCLQRLFILICTFSYNFLKWSKSHRFFYVIYLNHVQILKSVIFQEVLHILYFKIISPKLDSNFYGPKLAHTLYSPLCVLISKIKFVPVEHKQFWRVFLFVRAFLQNLPSVSQHTNNKCERWKNSRKISVSNEPFTYSFFILHNWF